MARKATGQVIERTGKAGRTFALRFRAYGTRRYVTLGTAEDGWDRSRAEAELRHVLADVERGIWQPYEPKIEEPTPEPSFHEFASEWFARHAREWRPHTRDSYEWALSYHLLAFFKDHRLSGITIEEVDRYKAAKQREGKLSNNSINATLTRLSQILEEAVEYERIPRNPAKGKRRRLKGEPRARSWVDPEQLPALLDAGDAWSRPIFATLAGTGMRPAEAVALNWRDVNLATQTIRVRQSKTAAGIRTVDLCMGLAEGVAEFKARSPHTGPDDPLFVNRQGARQTKDNISRRLKTAIKRANKTLTAASIEPLSLKQITPYSFRRTYASLRAALRDDAVYASEQMGHTDPSFTFRVYARAVKRRERLSGNYLEQFDRALEWARMGTNGASAPEPISGIPAPRAEVQG